MLTCHSCTLRAGLKCIVALDIVPPVGAAACAACACEVSVPIWRRLPDLDTCRGAISDGAPKHGGVKQGHLGDQRRHICDRRRRRQEGVDHCPHGEEDNKVSSKLL